MKRIITTDYFKCNGCGVECRIDSVPSDSLSAPITVRHCPEGKGIRIVGRVILFQQRRGSNWVSVEPVIDAA
jgi:hypothetical protein